ncbi:MAG: cold-shock protein [Rhodospirillales bacterium]
MTTLDNEVLGGHAASVAKELRGTVKWFNAVKGYGFLTPDNGARDAFLHVTVLRQIGREDIKPGATVTCEATSGPKGMQVLRIIDVDVSTCAIAVAPTAPIDGHDEEPSQDDDGRGFVAGVVKWFNNERGYGFVCPQDVERDVFVHAAVLRRNGLEQLQPGQTVRIRIGEGPKGLQVTDIRL